MPTASCQLPTDQCLVLRARRNLAVHCQISQEPFHFRLTHRVGMFDAVKADEAFDPICISLFGPVGKVLDAGHLPHLVEEFHGPTSRCHFPAKSGLDS
jgi:hypothetical protein